MWVHMSGLRRLNVRESSKKVFADALVLLTITGGMIMLAAAVIYLTTGCGEQIGAKSI